MLHRDSRRRITGAILTLTMVLTLGVTCRTAFDRDGNAAGTLPAEKIDGGPSAEGRPLGEDSISQEERRMGAGLTPETVVRASIVLERPSALEAGFPVSGLASDEEAARYRLGLLADQRAAQATVESALGKPLEVVWNLTLTANVISANVLYGELEAIKAVDGVKDVYVERSYAPASSSAGQAGLQPDMAVSGGMNGTPGAWDLGLHGEGMTIAIVDTGIDYEHQSFDEDAFLYALEEDDASPELTPEDVQGKLDRELLHGQGRYFNAKVPFGYNYADKNQDITHMNDDQTEHGSHVAGIAAANRYIKEGEGYVDALRAVKVAGNAPDAQLLALKVFGADGAARDSDVAAAIEDALTLGADVINLSLGVAVPGFASPEASDPYVNVQKLLLESDTVIVYSSGNAGNWASHTANGSLYNDGVNFQMGGASGSYTSSFTVASADNRGMISPTIEVGGKERLFYETLYTNAPFVTLDTSEEGQGIPCEFILVPLDWDDDGGNEADVLEKIGKDKTEGKIVVIWRGETSFSEKANLAAKYGAKAVIIANNEDDIIAMDLSEYTYTVPVVSVTRAVGMAIREAGMLESTGDSWDDEDYYTGTLTVHGVHLIAPETDGTTMSDFSSWGVPGSLELKPEITAPGGNIWSVFGRTPDHPDITDDYELMSGTSMAAPQIAGMTALVLQHLNREFAQDGRLTRPENMTLRALAQGLLMATASPLKDAEGRYYPLMQQGAGLANVAGAVASPVFVTVKGQTDGKVKAELGDDIGRDGTYTVEFTLHNMTRAPQSYTLSAEAFTQAVKDGKYLDYATRALGCAVTFAPGNEVTVPAGQSVTVTAAIALSETEKAKLNSENPGGAYIQAYLTAKAKGDAEGALAPTLSVPVLAFYGSWTDSSMFDLGSGDNWYRQDWPDGREGYTSHEFYDDYHGGEATNVLVEDDSRMLYDGGNVGPETGDLSYYYTLIRNAGNGVLRVTYEDGGAEKVLWQSDDLGPRYGVAYFDTYGMWLRPDLRNNLFYSLFDTADFDWEAILEKANEAGVEEIAFELIMAPEYYADESGAYNWDHLTDGDSDNGELGEGAYLRTTVKLDSTPPEMVETYQARNGNGETVIFVQAKDNMSVTDITLWGDDGETLCYEYHETVYNSDEYDEDTNIGAPNFTPTGPDQTTLVKFDGKYTYDFAIAFVFGDMVFDVDTREPLKDDVYVVEIRDAAGNTSKYRVFVGIEQTDDPADVTDVTVSDAELALTLGSTYQMTAAANPLRLKDRTVTWTSSNEAVAAIDETGLITALNPGNTIITATSNQNGQVSAACRLTVYTVPVTLAGILGDEDGDAKFFTWTMAKNLLEKGGALDMDDPLTAAGDGEGGSFVLDASYTMYHLDADGAVLSAVPDWTNADENAVPFDMAYSEKAGGLFLCYGNYIIGPVDPTAPLPEEFDAFDLSNDTRAWFYGIDIVEEPWEFEGEEGDWYIAAMDDLGYAWELCPYKSAYSGSDGYSAKYGDFPCFGLPKIVYGGVPYASLVAADGENWYYSVVEGDRSVVYRLTFTDNTGSSDPEYRDYDYALTATRLGNTGEGVWPALLLEVDTGTTQIKYDFNNDGVADRADAQLLLDHVVKETEIACVRDDMDVDGDGGVDTHDVHELLSRFEAVWAAASVDSVGLGDTGNGIALNPITRTVTVPVYAGSSANGLFTLTYDEALALDTVASGDMLTSCAVDEENRTVTVGFAALSAGEKDPVVTLTFSYKRDAAERDAKLTVSVSEEGTGHPEPPAVGEQTVRLPAEVEKVTFTGVMRDPADGKTYMFTWDLETGELKKGVAVSVNDPAEVSDRGDGRFYMFAKDGKMYLIDSSTGAPEGEPWILKTEEDYWGDLETVIPWSMACANGELFWGSEYDLYLNDTPDGSTATEKKTYDLLGSSAYPYAIAAAPGEWTEGGKSGDLTVYIFTDGSKLAVLRGTPGGDGYTYDVEVYETSLRGSDFGDDKFIEGEGSSFFGDFYPYTTMAVGEDGVLYLAALRGDPDYDDDITTELYKLTYDGTQGLYVGDLIGKQDVYPFLLLGVSANEPSEDPAPVDPTPSTPADPGAGPSPSSDVTTGDVTEDGVTSTETTARPGAAVSGGAAFANVSDATGGEIVDQAERNGSDTVVVAPRMPDDVTRAQVTLPGETLTGIAEKTDADLRVETPVGDVTIPNGALDGLGAGGEVTVRVEKRGDAIAVELLVNGVEAVTVSGGVRAALPLKDGEVAVTVSEDGTQTVIPKSIAEDGTVYVVLDGSATVKTIDNAKDFDDVKTGDWYQSAVDFVSSHELFNGMSLTAFEPGTRMSRSMLATVLWRLESSVETDGTILFPDVEAGTWYAEGAAWAGRNGIITGSDGKFEPDRDVTRQEMALMMYRYAKLLGEDVGTSASLAGFKDAADVESWAEDAMSWAVSVGLFQGDAGRLNPEQGATRAEVATVLRRLVSLLVK